MIPEADLDALAEETGFSGVVRIDHGAQLLLARAYGLAHRGLGVANRVDTCFALASGAKGLTALTVVSLIEENRLELTTTARSVLGTDLPLIDDEVTVEQLLAHRSGIGDYIDEERGLDISEYVMPVPVHTLATTEGYLTVLDGYPTKFPPDARFAYCNGGYVVLALIAERVGGLPFHELVHRRVCEPAGMGDTAFLRSDELLGAAALGYLEVDGVWRSNVHHLPVRGSGDGGVYSTAADVRALWAAFLSGRIVSGAWVGEMLRPHSDMPDKKSRYGLGFWLHATDDSAWLTGYDAGVSFCTTYRPDADLTTTVISNTSEGAWPVTEWLDERLGG